MKILAADTTTLVNTVALCDGDRVLAETIVNCGRIHSERLIETVDWVLKEAGIVVENVDLLAISTGPGSFTGVRVGTATWKGLALATKRPLVGVGTLDAMARLGAFYEGLVCPLLDAKMGEVFGALYRFRGGVREKLTPDRVCRVEDLIEGLEGVVYFLGEGANVYRARILEVAPGALFAPGLLGVPRASAVAAEALELAGKGVCTDAARVVPVYLRKSQAEQNREREAGGSPPRLSGGE